MTLRLQLLEARIAVCRLAPDAAVPSWVRGTFTSVTRTSDELSIVCESDCVPDDVRAEKGWRMFRVAGPIPFEMTGVAAAMVSPLAAAKISVFLVATFDTDYLLVKEGVLGRAIEVLRGAGLDVNNDPSSGLRPPSPRKRGEGK